MTNTHRQPHDLPGIENFEGWIRTVANKFVGPHSQDYDDFLQEARIGLWKGVQSFKAGSVEKREGYTVRDEYVGWITKVAYNHLINVVSRDMKWTGMPYRGSVLKDLTPDQPFAPFYQEDPEGSELMIAQYVEMAMSEKESHSDILFSAHRDELVAAINKLRVEDREYVYRLFWNDDRHVDIVGDRNWSMKRRILSRLSEALPHLKGLVSS